MSLPSNEGRQRRRRCWFHASSITKYVVVRSRVGWFEGHWSQRGGRSIRCAGAECSICASGREPEVFWYLFVALDTGEVLVWNPPARLEPLMRELDEQIDGGVGCVLGIQREGLRSNSRIQAAIVGYEPCEELDIAPFVATLGGDPSSSTSPPKSPRSGSETGASSPHDSRVNVTG